MAEQDAAKVALTELNGFNLDDIEVMKEYEISSKKMTGSKQKGKPSLNH